MARIIGGIACSHTPTIGFAVDGDKRGDPVWAPVFEGFAPARAWLEANRPDVLLMIFNDHVTSFFFDHYSAFALGIGGEYAVADEGGGPRDLPPVPAHAALSHHIGASLMADEFDMAFFQDRPLDHGCLSPLSMLCDHADEWPIPIVPLAVGVLQFPIPTARRCWRLGQALRRAVESYPEDLKVAIIATGGLSHQVHGARAGFNNTGWDRQFLDLLEHDPEALTRLTIAEYAELGGVEGSEVIMWLVMRGALSAQIRKRHESYYLPSMAGISVVIYESEARALPIDKAAAHRTKVDRELAGIEALPGSYPFTFARSLQAYRLNKFLHALIRPEWRQRFLAEPETLFTEADLSEEERDLVRRRDWDGLIRYGCIFFMLEKLGAVVGASNPQIYAAMRGETLEQFQATRNAPMLYSVTGTEGASRLNWDTPKKA